MGQDGEETVYRTVYLPSDQLAAGTRLDVFWTNFLDGDLSRARIQEAIAEGRAGCDGQVCRKPGFRLRGGEALTLTLETPSTSIVPEDAPLDVVYEDAHLAVLDKPAGLTVHPAPGLADGTLVNRLVTRFPALRQFPGSRPGIVHRLDKDTSGLLVVALTEAARLGLTEAFAAHEVHKTYLALVHGRPERDSQTIRLPIGRDPDHPTRMAVVKKGGREAITTYTRLWTAPGDIASLLSVSIATGRTHQIRVHLSALGHPLLGDTVYGPRQHAEWKRQGGPLAKLAVRQMLHAWKLSFVHPVTERQLDFFRPPPREFWRLLWLLGRRCQRVGLVGSPGCGKSTVLELAAAAGFPTFNADAVVAALYAPGGDGAHVLGRRFGPEALAPDGAVNKAWLLGFMRAGERNRREVMDLVHPLVRGHMEAFFREHARGRAAIAETPLLIETGWDKTDVDLVVGVACDPGVRRARLAGRGWSEAVMDDMDGWQLDEKRKLAKCTYTIRNSEAKSDLAAEVRRVLSALAERRRATALARYRKLEAAGLAGRPEAAEPVREEKT